MKISLPPRVENLKDNEYGLWEVLSYAGQLGSAKRSHWKCRCRCKRKTVRIVCSATLVSGVSTSCGCKSEENPNGRIHGERYTPLYRIWMSMNSRCTSDHPDHSRRYKSRGIKVCKQWRGRDGFLNFKKDMGERPSPKHQIDRRNNDGDYTPRNCRWATRRENNTNRCNNKKVTYKGITKTVTEWAELLKMGLVTLIYRIDAGWPVKKAFFTPVRPRSDVIGGKRI